MKNVTLQLHVCCPFVVRKMNMKKVSFAHVRVHSHIHILSLIGCLGVMSSGKKDGLTFTEATQMSGTTKPKH